MVKKKEVKKTTKLRQLSVGVYLDEKTKNRFNNAIRKEQDKQIKRGETPTISKSNVCTELIEEWLDENGY